MNFTYTCGYCGSRVTSERGMSLNIDNGAGYSYNSVSQGVYICPNCKYPTFIYEDMQVPGNKYGNSVANVSKEVEDVYNEARKSFSVGAYTGVILLCRKLLMHVSVDLGANENKRFIEYVDYLKENHYVPKNSEGWIDAIRKFGNKSTHDIVINTKEDAEKMIKFSEMLLKMNYEYPALMSQESDSTKETNS
ncbi:DUF4145 domain-containing protein [Leuconostoc pseudomesenteroides]|uniref:DUF4145 domain-containing protein n=1 Tax=Leuconostoc pseudomesenteroides TaxID=33968 RepID=UPI0021A78797|nr:DUF4145 domain-containing protein [Leuconostoc pseudomesenteroides]